MERYLVRMAFWAGFGQAMAVTILTLSIAVMGFGATTVDVVSFALGTAMFIAIGVVWGFDRAVYAKKRWSAEVWWR